MLSCWFFFIYIFGYSIKIIESTILPLKASPRLFQPLKQLIALLQGSKTWLYFLTLKYNIYIKWNQSRKDVAKRRYSKPKSALGLVASAKWKNVKAKLMAKLMLLKLYQAFRNFFYKASRRRLKRWRQLTLTSRWNLSIISMMKIIRTDPIYL